MFASIWRQRHLVSALARSQYELRFRQSFVGLLWALVPPLAILGVAVVVFDGVVKIETGAVPYPLFAMAGLLPWIFFANSLTFGVPSVVNSSNLVARQAFPRAALPLSMVGVSLLDLGVAAVIYVAFAYSLGTGLPITVLWAPLLIGLEVIFVSGVVLLGSALNVFARDVRLAVPVGVQLLMFLTPVMYPLSAVPLKMRPWFLANPMTGFVENVRLVLVQGLPPDPSLLVSAAIGSIVALAAGAWYFGSTEARFADAT